MATTTSSDCQPSQPLTRSDYLCTLPPWRRLLAMLNWRPVYDIEQEHRREIERLQNSALESEKLLQQLEQEDKRLDALESRLDALLRNADSSSQTPPATGSN